MKIALFGGTGGSGMEIIKQGLKMGFSFKVLARTPSKIDINNDNLEIIKGDLLDYESVKSVIEGTDRILSAIGTYEKGESHFYSDSLKNILKAMKLFKINRIMAISAQGVGDDPDPNLGFVTKLIIKIFFKKDYIDRVRMENLIKESNSDWTIMRPPMLTKDPLTKKYRTEINMSVKKGRKIARADLAHFMVNNIDNEEYYQKKVGIAY